MFEPSYFKRCACKVPVVDERGDPVLTPAGKPKLKDISHNCPSLTKKGHGKWAFYFETDAGRDGKRGRVRRYGFAKLDDAKAKAKELYEAAAGGTDVQSNEKCADFFARWIKAKKALARTTAHGYEGHIASYLAPHLGHIKRSELRVRHLTRMYDAIEAENAERLLHHARVEELEQARDAAQTAWVQAAGKGEERRRTRAAYLEANAALRKGRRGLRKITSATTMHRINDTLSSALTWGIKTEAAFAQNWAHLVELPSAAKPKPLVWTPERVEHWKQTGEKPGPVMVWTPEQTGRFLDSVRSDRLHALWHDLVFLGPRRGEVCALPDHEVSLSGLWLRISAQIVEIAYRLYGEAPKADSVRTVLMSAQTADVNRQWLEQRAKERAEWSEAEAYVDSGRFFVQENGAALHPDWVTRRFKRLVELAGLPPVRLHDLRHISATLSLLAKTDIKVVQEKLGHSSRQITSDTYTSVLPEMMRADAEAMMAVVPRQVAYDVHCALSVPAHAFNDEGLVAVFVHGARYADGRWSISLQTGPNRTRLGEIRTADCGAEHAAEASVSWVRDYCAAQGFVALQVEDLHESYPEDLRPHHSLVRLLLSRPSKLDLDGLWGIPGEASVSGRRRKPRTAVRRLAA